MSQIYKIKEILLMKLPIELVNKIIYTRGVIQTPSCRIIRDFLSVVKHKFCMFDDITSVKLRIIRPKCLLDIHDNEEWTQYYDIDDNINKMIIITYDIKNLSFKKVFRRRIYLFT